MNVEFPIVVNGKTIRVTQECECHTDLFEFIAEMQELFGDTTCRRNGEESDNVVFRVRDVDGNKFYESICLDRDGECKRAKRSYHLKKKEKGKMYLPKRKNDKWLPNDGWVVFNSDTGQEE